MNERNRIVSLVGKGRLARAIETSLGDIPDPFAMVRREDPLGLPDLSVLSGLLMIASDEWNPILEHDLLVKVRKLGLPILPVFGRANLVFIGPLEMPNSRGCIDCVQGRWQRSISRARWIQEIERFSPGLGTIRMPLNATTANLGRIGSIAVEIVQSWFLTGPNQGEQKQHATVHIFNTVTGQLTKKLVPPSHLCKRCGRMSLDTAEDAVLSLTSRPLADSERLRVHQVNLKTLKELYVDPDIGYLSALDVVEREGPVTVAVAHGLDRDLSSVSGSGYALEEDSAQAVAIFEALERSCGMYPTGKQTSVLGTHDELKHLALHPRVFGEHDESLYQQANPRFRPFNEHENYNWVWAYSLQGSSSVLIPEQIAYYGAYQYEPTQPRFVYETSNGCSVGTTLEEAILHGILEVLERDLFLNAWYGRIGLPEIRLGATCPKAVQTWLGHIQSRGFDVRFFDMSLDLKVPCILAIAVNQKDVFPKVFCAAAAHLNPYRAVASALIELYMQLSSLAKLAQDESKLASVREMHQDSHKVRRIPDHTHVNALPESFSRWSFLLNGKCSSTLVHPKRNIEDTVPQTSALFSLHTHDIKTILESLLSHIYLNGYDVLVVNQTNRELEFGGLRSVKVLIPGMLPMTFGFSRRRVKGLDRVLQLPAKLDSTRRTLDLTELNLDPHPFP